MPDHEPCQAIVERTGEPDVACLKKAAEHVAYDLYLGAVLRGHRRNEAAREDNNQLAELALSPATDLLQQCADKTQDVD